MRDVLGRPRMAAALQVDACGEFGYPAKDLRTLQKALPRGCRLRNSLRRGVPAMNRKTSLTFEQATLKAVSYGRQKEKAGRLVETAARKSRRHFEPLLASWESLQIFFRMIRAWSAGGYIAPINSILTMIAGVIYFLSSFDGIPDFIPAIGLADDAGVIFCVARANLTAISNFRKWEVRNSA